MITDEQREQLNSWFRCSVQNSKVEVLSEAALRFSKAIMESTEQGPDQDNALTAVRLAWTCASKGPSRG